MATLRLDERRVHTLKPHKSTYDLRDRELKGVVKRVSSPPIGALTGCFSSIRGGQFSALNNTSTARKGSILPQLSDNNRLGGGGVDIHDLVEPGLVDLDFAAARVAPGANTANTDPEVERAHRASREIREAVVKLHGGALLAGGAAEGDRTTVESMGWQPPLQTTRNVTIGPGRVQKRPQTLRNIAAIKPGK